MKNKVKYSIILPVYNESGAIEPLIEEIRDALASKREQFEIVAVDDGSTDGTSEILERLLATYPEMRLITLRKNFGQTAALAAGFDHGVGEVFITLDSDGQNDPADIPRLLEKIDEGYDCVMGWRRGRKDSWLTRKVPSIIANWLIRVSWKTSLKDFGCGLKAFRKVILKDLSFYGEMHRLLGLLLIGAGAKVISIPVNHRARSSGKSKYGLERTVKVVLDLMTVWFLDHFKSKPIHIFGSFALLFFSSSALCAVITLAQKFLTELSINRNPLFFMTIFLGIAGIQFIGIGLLSELMSRIYFESTERRPYAVRSVEGFEAVRARKAS